MSGGGGRFKEILIQTAFLLHSHRQFPHSVSYMKTFYTFSLLVGSLLALHSGVGYAAGFEKSILWSGKYAGLAGTASGIVRGAESLYFNPAGLSHSPGKWLDVSTNFSPIVTMVNAPLRINDSTGIDSERGFSPVPSVTVSFHPLKHLGFGAGFYASGGAGIKYNAATNFATSATSPLNTMTELEPIFETKLQLLEFSLGVGYELFERIRLGVSWRTTLVSGSLSSVQAPAVLTNFRIKDLSDTDYASVRAGLQYSPPSDVWGIGLAYRSKVKFSAEGNHTGTADGPGASNLVEYDGGKATVGGVFPHQVDVSVYARLLDKRLLVALGYNWTQYSKNKALEITGAVPSSPVPGYAGNLSDITFNWNDQHTLKVGLEYAITDTVPVRLGYLVASDVTPKDQILPTLAPPSFAHSITAGSGYTLALSSGHTLEFNGALDITTTSGEGSRALGADKISGKVKATIVATHLGVRYSF